MSCRICGNAVDNRPYVVPEMMYGTREAFDYFECNACGCLQIAGYPVNVERHYGAAYYSFGVADRRVGPVDRIRIKVRDRYEIFRRGRLGRYLAEREPNPSLANLAPALTHRTQRILEIGCGSGALLKSLRAIGFKHLTGADAFIEADVRIDRDFIIRKASLADIDGRFDVIMFHHSLEHMPDQHTVFRQIADRLQPAGKCVIRVPLSSSFAWEHYRIDWVQLDAPRHFYLHTIDSLGRLAASVGLRISKTIFDSTAFQFWGSEQYRRGIPLQDDRSLARCRIADSIFTREQMEEFRRRTATLNFLQRGDQAVFIMDRVL